MSSKVNSAVIDGARAAVLAAHTAAGMCSQLRKEHRSGIAAERLAEAARILRASEALSRSAVSLLTIQSKDTSKKSDTPPKSGDVRSPSRSAKRSAARRQKKKEKKKENMDIDTADDTCMPYNAASFQPSSGISDVVASLQQVASALNVGSSSAGLNPGAHAHFPIGTKVVIEFLTARSDLNGHAATVIKDDKPVGFDDRVAVMVDRSGEEIRIKTENLTALAPTSFGGIGGSMASAPSSLSKFQKTK